VPIRPERVEPRPLRDIADLLGVVVPALPVVDATVLTGITHDSRQVQPGDLYAALPGANTHGARFGEQAVASGAAALWTDAAGAGLLGEPDVPVLVSADPRRALGRVAAFIYGEPATELLMIGVTGTNGKTTTSYLIEAGLRAAGHTTGQIGTIETLVAGARIPSMRTTPEATDVHALLAVMGERGVTACVMEVSSHAMAFGRVDGIVFDVAGFTNLSQDHLDFHRDLEDYFATKASLFTPERSVRGVVCVDDAWGRRLAAEAKVPIATIATTGPAGAADWHVAEREVPHSGASTAVELRGPDGAAARVVSPLAGEFNVANAVLAVVLLLTAGLDVERVIRGIASCPGVPGRMERVQSTRVDEPLAVVDYAHTPDALENVLRALRPATRGRLIVVLGAGGDRDREKRPLMGAVAATLADLVIVTDDNPRSENPATIRAAMLDGASGRQAEVREIADRRSAIVAAVSAASGRADTVLVAGKGHEQGQEVAGRVLPFDDRVELRAALDACAPPRSGSRDTDDAPGHDGGVPGR
jgi:UDP-N-acetylmuramoyl-L-alanyl-D-glutamate--2,6-diaminopimelate ligase